MSRCQQIEPICLRPRAENLLLATKLPHAGENWDRHTENHPQLIARSIIYLCLAGQERISLCRMAYNSTLAAHELWKKALTASYNPASRYRVRLSYRRSIITTGVALEESVSHYVYGNFAERCPLLSSAQPLVT